METKRCARCKKEKPRSEFNKKGNGLQSSCRMCQSEYQKDWYRKNQQRHIQNVMQNKRETREWLRQFKKTLSCEECGESRSYCLDFHHKNAEEKDGSISEIVAIGHSVKRIMQEIKKCRVLCANCHRHLHWLEAQEKVAVHKDR